MANFQPPPGFIFDPNSGMYYQSVAGNDPATGQAGNWVTWFNAGTGEYVQQFYPVVVQQQVVQQQTTPPFGHPSREGNYAHAGYQQQMQQQQMQQQQMQQQQMQQQYAGLQPQKLNPLLYLIPVVSLIIGVGLAFVLYGRDTPSGNGEIKPDDLVVVVDDGGFGDTDNTTMPSPTPSPSPLPSPSPEVVTLQPHDADRERELAILNQVVLEWNSVFTDDAGLEISVFVRDYELVFAYHMGFSLAYEESKRRHFEHVDSTGIFTGIVEELRGLGIVSPVVVVEYWDENNTVFYSYSYRALTDHEKVMLEEVAEEIRREARERGDDSFSFYVYVSEVALVTEYHYHEDFGIDYAELEEIFRMSEFDRVPWDNLVVYIREKGVEFPLVIAEYYDIYGVLVYKELFR